MTNQSIPANEHYRDGRILPELRRGDIPSRTQDKLRNFYRVDEGSGCWVWQGALRASGYGAAYLGRGSGRSRSTPAHRAAFVLSTGESVEGLVVDHKCKNRACINPDHLQAVTNGMNVLIGDGPCAKNALKTHCNYGHSLSGQGVYLTKDGHRICRVCRRAREKQYHLTMTEKALQALRLAANGPIRSTKKGPTQTCLIKSLEQKGLIERQSDGSWVASNAGLSFLDGPIKTRPSQS